SIDLISAVAIEFNGFKENPSLFELTKMGTPSITYNGSLLPLIEFPPRILTDEPAPGIPEFCTKFTPATLPCNAWSTERSGVPSRSCTLTDDTAPVISDRLCVP